MKKSKFTHNGPAIRLDVFLTGAGEDISRPYARRLIEGGLVTVNGLPRRPSFNLADGDKVELTQPKPEADGLSFADLLLFEDKHLMAVAKPAGLAVHPNSPHWEVNPQASQLGEPTLVSLLYAERPATGKAGMERLGLVHRLDRDTSGLMILAKTKEAQETLTLGFRERLMQKTYMGAVGGVPVKRSGTIDAPIGRAAGFKKIKVWEYGRDAVTDYKIKEKGKDCALLEIHPRTGRTNQIRIHMEFIGHSILGDSLYGGRPAARMLLHSLSLAFEHPHTGKLMELEAPLPADFKSEWKAFKAGKK